MGAGGNAGESQKTTTVSKQPPWVTPIAKAYIDSLAGMVFPGTEIDAKNPAKSTFGTMQGNTGATSGGNISTAQANSSPFAAMIAGSPYLQQLYGSNPGAAAGASGGAAYQQLAQIYPGLFNLSTSTGSS